MLSTLDLYAVHVLASGNPPSFVTLPSGYHNELMDARSFLPGLNHSVPIPEFNASYNMIMVICIGAFICLHRKKRRGARMTHTNQ